MLQAYAEGYDIQAYIFRFVSILGERYTHGHVFDFYKQLHSDPTKLKVLGDGKQRKSYLYVGDCIDFILNTVAMCDEKVNIYNLGTREYVEVNQSIGYICEHLGINPDISYGGGERGWVGDSPFIYLDTQKVREAVSWDIIHGTENSTKDPDVTIKEGIIKTLEYLQANPHLLERK